MINKTNVVLDLETLGVVPRAIILAIGAVAVTSRGETQHFYLNVHVEQEGRVVSPGTVEFWQRPDLAAVWEEMQHNQFPLDVAMSALNRWVSGLDDKRDILVWGNSSDFDIAMWRDANSQLGQKDPFEFWNTRCIRTLNDADRLRSELTGKPTAIRPKAKVEHHALYDAWAECEWLYNLFNNMKS